MGLARIIKGHGVGNYVMEDKLLCTLTDEEDPESFIAILEDMKILDKKILLNTCCETPFIEVDYCIQCSGQNKVTDETYYLIVDLIEFVDEWRARIYDRINDAVSAVDRDYLRMISSQVKSLESNPVIPLAERLKENQYQFIGSRILNYIFEVDMESLKKDGRTDLKFKLPGEVKNFVGEYKIWSRRSKTSSVVDQCLDYFDSDTESGFVFMVNDMKTASIWDDYIKSQVESSKNFVKDKSAEFILIKEKNGIVVYSSAHLCPISKKRVKIYHFIYDLYGNFGVRESVKKRKGKSLGESSRKAKKVALKRRK